MRRFVGLLALFFAASAAPAAHADTATFETNDRFSVPLGESADNTVGISGAWPSTLTVSGIYGAITDADVTLDGVTHTRPDDIDAMLYTGNGGRLALMSDACGDSDISGYTWKFDQAAANAMGDTTQCNLLTYRPTDYVADTWPTPVVSANTTTLNSVNGSNAVGRAWRLYVNDDLDGDYGAIESGWSLRLTTGPYAAGFPGSGPATEYPLAREEPAAAGGAVIEDVDITLPLPVHDRPADLDILIEGPHGEKAMLMSDACGSDPLDFSSGSIHFDDEAPVALAQDSACGLSGAARRPADYEPSETLPAPAPGGAYGAALSAFDGTRPGGTWKLWIHDDTAVSGGYLPATGATLEVTTRPPLSARFTAATTAAAEGSPATLTVERAGTGTPGPASVRVRPIVGSASADDFDATERVVTFARGQTSATVDIPIAADGVAEGEEAFSAVIIDPSGDAAIGTPSIATVTVAASTAGTVSTTPGDTPPGTGGIIPPAAVSGLPIQTSFRPFRMPSNRRCVRRGRRIAFRASKPVGVRYARTEVLVNGRRALLRRATAADDVIRLRMRRRRTRVVIRVTTVTGQKVSASRTYRRCGG